MPEDLASIFLAAQNARAYREQLEMQKEMQRAQLNQYRVQQDIAYKQALMQQKQQEFQQKITEARMRAAQGSENDMRNLIGLSPKDAGEVLSASEKMASVSETTRKTSGAQSMGAATLVDRVISDAIEPLQTQDGVFETANLAKLSRGAFALKSKVARGEISGDLVAPVFDVLNRFYQQGEIDPRAAAEELRGVQMAARQMAQSGENVEAKILADSAAMLAARTGRKELANWQTAIDAGFGEDLIMGYEALSNEARKTAEARASRTVVNVGGAPGNEPMPSSVQTQAATELRMLNKMIDRGGKILERATPDMFGVGSKIKEAATFAKDALRPGSLSPSESQWKARKKEILSDGIQLMYDFLVSMSGKTVSDKERAMVLRAIGDPDSMSLEDYRSTIQAVVKASDEARRGVRGELSVGMDLISDPKIRAMIDQENRAIAREAMRTKDLDRAKKRSDALQRYLKTVTPGVLSGESFVMPPDSLTGELARLRSKSITEGLTGEEEKRLLEIVGQ